MKKALKVPREHETKELIYISDSEFKFQKEKKMHSHFKRTIWQPRNHNSPVKGMSQRLFSKWIVSGSRGPFWKQVWSRAQPHFLGLQQKTCSTSLHIIPIHPHIPSAPLQTGSAPALVLQEKTVNSVVEGVEATSTDSQPGWRKVLWYMASPPMGFGSQPGGLTFKNE